MIETIVFCITGLIFIHFFDCLIRSCFQRSIIIDFIYSDYGYNEENINSYESVHLYKHTWYNILLKDPMSLYCWGIRNGI